MNKNKKILIILLSIILLLVISLIVILIFRRNDNKLNTEQKELKEAISNTSISSEKVESYRAKVSIKTKSKEAFNKSYIVYNNKNSDYDITLFEGDDHGDIKSINIKNNEKKDSLDYDYTNTDIFMEGLEKGTNIKKETKTLGYDNFILYSFDIDKDIINNILKIFKISTKYDGKGQVYLDKNNSVYLITYDTEDINISVSYTRIEEKK